MTPHEFAPIWLTLLQACPSAKPIDGTSSLYARKLAPFTRAEVAAAVDALILEDREFLPPLGTIWQRCLAARDQAPGWEEAWQEAREHASSPAAYPWAHEAVRDAARSVGGLGLHEIRESTNPPAMRAQFRDAYQSVLQRRRREYASSARELPPARRPELEPSR